MTPQPSDDDKKKSQRKKFHEQGLEAGRTQQEHDAGMKERHGEEERSTQAHAHEDLVHEAALEKKTKEATKDWRRKDKANKEAIETEKQRRLDETDRLEKRKRKDRDYEEKQHAFFESFRGAAAAKALAERTAYGKDMDLKKELLRLEKEAFAAKQKADADETIAKNDIERDSLTRKDRIRHDAQAKRDAVFGEESRAKVQLKDLQLRDAVRGLQKHRADTDAEEQRLLRELEQETIRKKNAAEAKTRKTRTDIDAEFWRKKAEITERRKHVMDPENDDRKR